jgi:hypothetical protein
MLKFMQKQKELQAGGFKGKVPISLNCIVV